MFWTPFADPSILLRMGSKHAAYLLSRLDVFLVLRWRMLLYNVVYAKKPTLMGGKSCITWLLIEDLSTSDSGLCVCIILPVNHVFLNKLVKHSAEFNNARATKSQTSVSR